MDVVFDLFDTLVDVSDGFDSASAMAGNPASRGVAVPDDWRIAYREMDGGIETVGGTFIDVNAVPLTDFPGWLEER